MASVEEVLAIVASTPDQKVKIEKLTALLTQLQASKDVRGLKLVLDNCK